MRYNNNLYLVNKYVRLKSAILMGYSLGKGGQTPKIISLYKSKTLTV